MTRGIVLKLHGDPEIAGAIARGMLEARGRPTTADVVPLPADAGRHSFPISMGKYPRSGGWGTPTADAGREGTTDQVEIISAEADHWRTVAKLVRVAIGNTKTPEDYEIMLIRAKGRYGMTHLPGPVRVVAGKMLLAWALLWQGIRRAYRAQDRLLSPGSGGRCR